jgi:Xaa-Pro dipeptidase
MRQPTYPSFTLDEYRARLSALRKRMAAHGLDALVLHTPENICYISGYQTPGYYWYMALIVPLEREPVLIPPPHEESLVRAYSWVDDYRLFRDTTDWAAATRDTLESLGLGKARIGLEHKSWFLTADIYLRLKALMPGALFSDGSGLVEEGRMVKSPAEIACIRRAAKAAEAGMAAGIEACRAGATEAEVAVAAHSAQIRAGSEYTGLPMFISSGERSLMVHSTWSDRRMRKGDVVFLEVPGSVNRYHAALSRCAFIGNPPDLLLRASEVNTDALRLAKAAIRPGVPARDVFEAARARIDGANIGYKQGRRVAYGLGIAFPPGWDEGHIISININETRPLQPGMVFHLITTMRLQGLGAIGCSDTVLVTEAGCETLTAGVGLPPHVR